MTREKNEPAHPHGPENAEFELKKSYNAVIDTSIDFFWDRNGIPGVNGDEAITVYKHAFNQFRKGNRLAAERWARTAKHLARALQQEAKLAYFEPRIDALPYLEGATPTDYGLEEHGDTTVDLLNSVAEHVPPGMTEMPEEMKRYVSRARRHLDVLNDPDYRNELLRITRVRAAYEYSRVLECSALAYEAENLKKEAA